jgi:RND family efflux transporter MFP subunit
VLIAVMELIVSQLALWDARHETRQQDDATETAAAIVDLISRLESASSYTAAGQLLVHELSQFLDGPTVSFLRSQQGKLSLQAHTGESVPGDDVLDLLIAAGDEAVIRGEPGLWPAPEGQAKHCLLTHRQLAQRLEMDCVLTFPLLDEHSHLQGVLVLTGTTELLDPPDGFQFLRAASTPLASCLRTLQRTERPHWQRRLDKWVAQLSSAKGRWLMLGAVAAAGVLAIPLPYNVQCDCELQPVTRRYVAAPFEGRLEKCLVEPGDVVTAGQLLARLDGREIQWELEGVQADQHRAQKERDGHLASGKYGEAELSRLEAERLRLKTELLQHRGTRLEITSPIEGIIVSGDLRRTEGAPVQVGQSLFEVAPLDAMTIEVRIPEREIAYVQPGQTVDVTLDAFPGRHWPATFAEVHPRAQVHEGEQVFLAEIDVPNEHELLRPGMRGQARIRTASRPLGWNLFHHAWEKLAMWAGW